MSGLDIIMAVLAMAGGAYVWVLVVVAAVEAGRWLAGRLGG
jgi:hypothetical protein